MNPSRQAAVETYQGPWESPHTAGPPWAGFWLRAEAKLWDISLLSLATVGLVSAAALMNARGGSAWGIFQALWAALVLTPVYFVYMTARWGQTLGKMVVGIRVVDSRGRVPTTSQVMGRLVLEWLFSLLFRGIPLLVADYLWVAWSREKRALHDLSAGTYVVRIRAHRRRLDALLLIPVLILGCSAPFVVRARLLCAYYIPSGSSEPTLEQGDRTLCNRLTLRLRPPRFGDIIVFDAPEAALGGSRSPKDFISRVVGVPGDRLQVKGGKLWRNGRAVQEPYLKEPMDYTWPEEAEKGGRIVVPPGNLVVLGDNRNDSNDSHRWYLLAANGEHKDEPFLAMDRIRGVFVFRFWPRGRIGPIGEQ